MNGDGYPDLAVGAPQVAAIHVYEGALYVFFDPLHASTADDADVTIRGAADNDEIGG